MKTIAVFLGLFLGVSLNVAEAQFGAQSFIGTAETIVLEPSFPQPGETVTATVNSAGAVEISWSLNGVSIPEADNRRSVEFVAGEAGSADTVRAVITPGQGGSRALTATIEPTYLDIVLEPQTRVPDFYLGRSLPSIGSVVNATALFHSDQYAASGLSYVWQLNQQVLEGGALRGQNQISFETPRGANAVLSVQVLDRNGSVVGSRAILLSSVAPELHFYEMDSLHGQNPQALSNGFILNSENTSLQAEPYHLDIQVYNQPDISTWSIDGTVSDNQQSNPYLVILQTPEESGTSLLEFHVRDTTQVLQGVEASIRVNY